MVFSSLHEFCFMASIESKRLHRNDNFSFGSIKKSHDARPDEYGSWSIVFVAFLALNSVTTVALCDDALSSCKIEEFFFHKSGRFWLIFSRKHFSTAKYYSLSTICPSGMNSSSNIEEHNENHLEFWAILTWFFRFRLDFCLPFRWLLTCLHDKFVDPCLITRYDTFYECGIRISAIQYV